MDYENIILIISDDKSQNSILKDYLSRHKYNVIFAETADKAEKLLIKARVNLVIADINMPEINGFKLFILIKKYSPDSRVIICGSYDESDVLDFANNNGIIKYFQKPVDLENLRALITELFSGKGITGNIRDINLFDFLQLLMLSASTKLISVTNPKVTNLIGLIYLKAGKIIQAEYGNLEGLKALSKIMSMKNGFFSEIPWGDPFSTDLDISLKDLADKKLFNHGFEINEKNYQNLVSKENFSRNDIKILVTDDDKMTLLIMNEYLTNCGYTVYMAPDAIEGSKIVRENSIDLVITDINMPEVNGFEFLIWINNNSPGTQIIIMSTYYSDENKKFSKDNGAIKYFQKPVDLKELSSVIDQTILNKGFSGSVNKVSVSSFLRMLELSSKPKLLSFSEAKNNNSGLIYFKDKKIIHAQYNNLTGLESFYKIIQVKDGIFSELPWIEPARKSINLNFEELMSKLPKSKPELTAPPPPPPKNLPDKANKVEKFNNPLLENRKKQLEALDKWKNSKDRLVIYESGVAMGIVVGHSTKEDVLDLMKYYSNIKYEDRIQEQLFFFEDIDVTVLFNIQEKVDEIRFGSFFEGKTASGLRIGDKLERAFDLYGKPKVSTDKGAVWDNLALYCRFSQKITSIRLKNADFFQVSSNSLMANKEGENTMLLKE